MTYISPDTDPTQLESMVRIGDREKLRTSEVRRRYLERIACIHARETVYVELGGEQASIDIAGADSHFGHTDRVVITIPTVIPPQVATNLDGKVWDLLFQKIELYHELGHHLYTDWPSYEDHALQVDKQWQHVFHNYWNILEDAAIERALSGRFNVENDLWLKNENLLTQHKPGENGIVSLVEAVSIVLLEYKHELGGAARLLDPGYGSLGFENREKRQLFIDVCLPITRDYAGEVKHEDDPVKRNELIYEMFEHLKDALDESTGTDPLGLPHSEQGDENDGSKGAVIVIMGGGGSSPGGAGSESEAEYNAELRRESEEDDDEGMEPEAFLYLDAIQQYKRDTGREVGIELDGIESRSEFEDGFYDSDRHRESERLTRPLEREWQQRLQQERKTQKRSGQRSGRPDTGRLWKTERGEVNVFKNYSKPDEKDYTCVIIHDRSGSLDPIGGENMVKETEVAVGALAGSLMNVGVDVSVISFYKGRQYLDLPFGMNIEKRKRSLFNGYADGGTPLSDSLVLARERLKRRGGNPFIIVVTDGHPANRELYRDELHATNFPVAGIYVAETGDFGQELEEESSYFHALRYCKYTEVMAEARALTRQIMF